MTLQGFEALKVLANGNSTKIVVPSDIQNVMGLLTAVADTLKSDNAKLQNDKKEKASAIKEEKK